MERASRRCRRNGWSRRGCHGVHPDGAPRRNHLRTRSRRRAEATAARSRYRVSTPRQTIVPRPREARIRRPLNRAPNSEIAETEGDVGVLRYPVSATAAEKPLPHKGPESFASWTSPVRPRSPALVKSKVSASPLRAARRRGQCDGGWLLRLARGSNRVACLGKSGRSDATGLTHQRPVGTRLLSEWT